VIDTWLISLVTPKLANDLMIAFLYVVPQNSGAPNVLIAGYHRRFDCLKLILNCPQYRSLVISFSLLENYYSLKLLMSVLFNWVAADASIWLNHSWCLSCVRFSLATPNHVYFIAKSFAFYMS
jgi:hypothetical protein